jgi:hypothetical protein
MATIYMLYVPDYEKVYIGSTKGPLNKRYNNHKNGKTTKSQILFSKGIPIMKELEIVREENRYVAEQEWINLFGDSVLNAHQAYRTQLQIRTKYRESKKLWAKNHRAELKKLKSEFDLCAKNSVVESV